jgi:Trk-type K+ transport system membrane component
MDILFEVISAIATCGYSLGITTSLTLVSKVIIIVLMFIGRVSTVTMTVAIAGKKFKENKLINYPKADIKL